MQHGLFPIPLFAIVLAIAPTACGGDTGTCCIDDYRESALVIQGSVRQVGGAGIVGAILEFTAQTPQFLRGDTAATDLGGIFRARLTTFGVGTFLADVRLRLRPTANGSVQLDTLLTGVRVVENRGGAKPDTVRLTLQLQQP